MNRFRKNMGGLILALGLLGGGYEATATNQEAGLLWLKDAGLGLFIHWSVDSQLGVVISHSLVGASAAYCDYFFDELPRTFNPSRFDADAWARLAKVAGFQYVVFTAKHHSGFCMFDSQTTTFDITATPYKRDVLREIISAFRQQGLKIGLYFSPDDFHVLYQQGTLISRLRPEAMPENNEELMQLNRAQIEELLTQYGTIDILFLDGPKGHNDGGLSEWVWTLQPGCTITRGAIVTPEISASTGQTLPAEVMEVPWEANFTMGTSWHFKPTNETYKPGHVWIQNLIETRAKGGTMLLNIGPEPTGEIPQPQENILREIAAWMAINREAIYDVRPWHVVCDEGIWYVRHKTKAVVYAFLPQESWPLGERRAFLLRHVRATDETVVSILGQNDEVLEYKESIPITRWQQTEEGLLVSAMRAQRIYNDRTWANPVVLKIANPEMELR